MEPSADSSMSTASDIPRHAPYPFNRPDADVVLRSSDKIQFRVHRNILTIASPFFESMFSLPQPAADQEDLHIVDVTQDGHTMEALLRICYPVSDPVVETMELARSVLEAALKYETTVAITFSKHALQDFVKTQPLRVYAIACRLQLESIAKSAAREAVAQKVIDDQYVAELEEIPAGCYHRLLQCRRKGIDKTALFVYHGKGSKKLQSWSSKQSRGRCSLSPGSDAPFPFDDVDADLMIISSDQVRFRVLKAVVALASPVLKNMLKAADSSGKGLDVGLQQHVLPTLHVEESGQTLHLLLQLCYPSCNPNMDDMRVDPVVIRAAVTEYRMEKVSWSLIQRMSDLDALEPLQAYLLAGSCNWEEQVIAAARNLLALDFEKLQTAYVTDLEDVSAGIYYRLLQYHKKCGIAAAALAVPDLSCLPNDVKEVLQCNFSHPRCGNGPWYRDYLDQVSEHLKKKPCSSIVTDEPVLVKLIQNAAACNRSSCMGRMEQILCFTKTLARAVDNEIKQVDTRLLFQQPA